jgi:hypothetical protein
MKRCKITSKSFFAWTSPQTLENSIGTGGCTLYFLQHHQNGVYRYFLPYLSAEWWPSAFSVVQNLPVAWISHPGIWETMQSYGEVDAEHAVQLPLVAGLTSARRICLSPYNSFWSRESRFQLRKRLRFDLYEPVGHWWFLELQLKMWVSAAAAVWSAWLGFEKRNHTSSYSRKYNPTSAIKFLATLRSSWLVMKDMTRLYGCY